MNPTRSIALLCLLLIAGGALAGTERLRMSLAEETIHHGAPIGAKALGDTIYLLGNPRNPDQVSEGGIPPQANGTFEDQFGNPGWFGWTHKDLTYSADSFWQVSDFNAVAGDFSMWCGTDFAGDPGYGNDWHQYLVFTHQIPDAGVATTVNLVCTIQVDTEPAYDFVYVEFDVDGVWQIWNVGGYDGLRTFAVDADWTYQPGDYVGSGGDEIRIRIRFTSDGAWSDEDGLWDTDGACQVDDITVTVAGVVVDHEDFEDQESDRWLPGIDPGVGDYAAFYQNLQDMDPCRSNYSWQVAFIDDGVVVPWTGGTTCTTWCYGPGGWIVNNTGGLMGPDFYIHNRIESPPLVWPAGMDAAIYSFDAYRHEELGAYGTWPGIFYQWHVKSVNTGDPDDLYDAPYLDRNFVLFGPPGYIRHEYTISDLLAPGRTHVMVALDVVEYGYVWGWVGTDGTPAPYFDNASLRAFPYAGPAMTARSIDLFNDNFPASGDLDLANLASNAVRLDAAQNVAPDMDLVNYPGDSIWFDVAAVRAGSVLHEMPKLHVRMKANPLFDGVRVLPPNFSQEDDIITGWVEGDSTYNAAGTLIGNRYSFDLPDDDFFFPGDVLRYYVEAKDNVAGDIGTTLIPADTAGFSQPTGNIYSALRYDRDFEVRALPTVFGASGAQPRVLFWQDSIDRGGYNEWLYALAHNGMIKGFDFDLYATNGPSSGVGNGLGGRATSALLSGYDILLYTSASLSVNLLANGDFENDPSNDLAVVSNWFAQGGKHALMTGDDLVSGLLDAGAQGAAFVNSYFNVNFIDKSVQPFISDQTAPRVAGVPGNGVIVRVPAWIAYGGCPSINTFDALEANPGTVRLAEFTDPNHNPGVYTYAAGSYYYNSVEDAEVVLLPYDLMYLHNAAGWQPPVGYSGIPARSIILEDILNRFGYQFSGVPVGVTPDAPLTARSFPNPFNPATTIRLTLPRAGQVSLKVFSVRGELVRTLVDDRLEAGVHDIPWDGRGNAGNQLASGVYFYEARAGGEALVEKMTLLK